VKEIALHVLDVVQNCIEAGAKRVSITVDEDLAAGVLTVDVADDGQGIDPDKLETVMDPFTTTRTTRRVGLGLPLLAATARQSGGNLTIDSTPGRGTRVRATFRLDHIDRPPLGDMATTLACLMAANPSLGLDYRHCCDGRVFEVSSEDFSRHLDGVSLSYPGVYRFIRDYLVSGIGDLPGSRSRSPARDPQARLRASPNNVQGGREEIHGQVSGGTGQDQRAGQGGHGRARR